MKRQVDAEQVALIAVSVLCTVVIIVFSVIALIQS